MSGREFEPVAAFFPSIDRNLIRDLDRHLRNAQARPPEEAQGQTQPTKAQPMLSPPKPAATPQPPRAESAERPDIDGIVEAVEHAASHFANMTSRTQELEAQVFGLEATNGQLQKQLADALQRAETAEARAKTDAERAETVNRVALQQAARADTAERELALALADLNRVTDAISAALGLSQDEA